VRTGQSIGTSPYHLGGRVHCVAFFSPICSARCVLVGRVNRISAPLVSLINEANADTEAWRIVLKPTISWPFFKWFSVLVRTLVFQMIGHENVEWLCGVRNRSGHTGSHFGDDFLFIARPNPTFA
jgi:hypothetical protein